MVLSFMGCQAPLYDAYKRKDVPAIKRGLAAGEDPYATRPSNWWWKVPTIPFALTVDISRVCLAIGTLGLYPELEYLIKGSRYVPALTGYVLDYGSVSVAEAVEKGCLYSSYNDNRDYINPRKCSVGDAAVMVALLESGKVNSSALLDWCFIYAIHKNDAALARTCLNKGYRMVPDSIGKTPLMQAIEVGSGDVARVMMQYGASIHETTRSYSCQFVAQESGHLDLYRSLGGKMVDQPVAPGIICKACRGTGYGVCSSCDGSGRRGYYYTEVHEAVNPHWADDKIVSGTFYDTCDRCLGGGRDARSRCPQCNGAGSFSRYGPIPQ